VLAEIEDPLGRGAPFLSLVVPPVNGLDHLGARKVPGQRAEDPRPQSVKVHDVESTPGRLDSAHTRVEQGFEVL
jgi:hypothetical protein